MNIFKEELKLNITKALPSVSPDKVESVVHELTEVIGTTEMSDVELLKEDDLKHILKPLEIRKLLRFWAKVGSTTDAPPAIPVQTANIVVEVASLSPARDCMWAENFIIPWAKMPRELLVSLEKGERPLPSLRRLLVRIICNTIYEIHKSPGKKVLEVIAKKVVTKYPKSFQDTLCGEVVGNGISSLVNQFVNKFDNLNRGSGVQKPKCILRKSNFSSPVTVTNVRSIKKRSYGCCNWQPDDLPLTETKESQFEKQQELKNIFKMGPKHYDMSKITKLMEETYISQRIDINSNMLTKDLLESWPFLFHINLTLEHFKMLVNVDLNEKMHSVMAIKSKILINCLYQDPPSASKDLKKILTSINCAEKNQDLLLLISLIVAYFGEKLEMIFLKTSETACVGEVEAEQHLPATPCLIMCGHSVESCSIYMLAVDGQVVCDHISDFTLGFLMTFAAFYILNIQYPEDVGCTLEFIQRCFFNINPLIGSKIKKNSGKRSAIAPKVLTLLNVLADYEWMEK